MSVERYRNKIENKENDFTVDQWIYKLRQRDSVMMFEDEPFQYYSALKMNAKNLPLPEEKKAKILKKLDTMEKKYYKDTGSHKTYNIF